MTPLQPVSVSAPITRDAAPTSEGQGKPTAGQDGGPLRGVDAPLSSRPVAALANRPNVEAPSLPRASEDAVGRPGQQDEARPVPPLKSFAKIPMQVVAEINKLREEAAETKAKGMEGRLDPTPMPADPKAIGPKATAPAERETTPPREPNETERGARSDPTKDPGPEMLQDQRAASNDTDEPKP